VAGVFVLASSFGPWWVLRLAPGGRLAEDYGSHISAFSAWQAPGRWPLAVALALVIATAWSLWRLVGGEVPGWLRGLLIMVSAVPIMLAIHQWRDIPPKPPLPAPSQTAELSSSAQIRLVDEFVDPGMDPEQLYREENSLSRQGPGWGLYGGITGMALLAVALLVSRSHEPPPGQALQS